MISLFYDIPSVKGQHTFNWFGNDPSDPTDKPLKWETTTLPNHFQITYYGKILCGQIQAKLQNR